jgi:hypothetical protein
MYGEGRLPLKRCVEHLQDWSDFAAVSIAQKFQCEVHIFSPNPTNISLDFF